MWTRTKSSSWLSLRMTWWVFYDDKSTVTDTVRHDKWQKLMLEPFSPFSWKATLGLQRKMKGSRSWERRCFKEVIIFNSRKQHFKFKHQSNLWKGKNALWATEINVLFQSVASCSWKCMWEDGATLSKWSSSLIECEGTGSKTRSYLINTSAEMLVAMEIAGSTCSD